MKRAWIVLALIALVAALAAGCGDATATGELRGWVEASSVEEGINTMLIREGAVENPVAGVAVTVEGTRLNGTTDENGYFCITGIPAGTRTLAFAKDGYEANRLQTRVMAGKSELAARAIAKKWTVLVYLDGDNNLESYGIKDVNEMETVGSTADVNIVVQFDRIKRYDRTNGDWTNTRRYYILKDTNTSTIYSTLLENMVEQPMDSGAVLQSFLQWGATNYPADNYLLVYWNHGAGVWPKYNTLRGACFDDTSGSSACLTTDEIRIAMANAQAATGQHIDVVAWDACLMQMIEVGYEFQGVADYMVGSEEVTPGNGFPYNTMMAALTADPLMTARSCATMLVDKFVASYATTSVCSSAVDMTAWGTFVQNVKTFAAALNGTTASLSTIQLISEASQRYEYNEDVDLYDFASGIYNSASISDTNLKNAAKAVMDTWAAAVIYNKATGTLNNGRSHGLAILLPTTLTEWGYYSLYGDLLWPGDTYWNEFIVRLTSYM